MQSEKTASMCQMPQKQSCSYCGSSHPPTQCLACGKKFVECDKVKEVCKSRRNKTVHDLKQEPDKHHKEDHIDTVNINSIIFKSKQSVITSNLKISCNQISILVLYKVHKGIDGNIRLLHIYNRFCRSLVFSGTVHWFVGRQAFIHYCGLHQV